LKFNEQTNITARQSFNTTLGQLASKQKSTEKETKTAESPLRPIEATKQTHFIKVKKVSLNKMFLNPKFWAVDSQV